MRLQSARAIFSLLPHNPVAGTLVPLKAQQLGLSNSPLELPRLVFHKVHLQSWMLCRKTPKDLGTEVTLEVSEKGVSHRRVLTERYDLFYLSSKAQDVFFPLFAGLG